MKMKNNLLNKVGLVTGFTCLLLTGCKAPSLTPLEQIELPTSYDGKNVESENIAALAWTEFFPDTLLQGYITKAVTNNHSFLQTIERVSIARSQMRVGKGALLPEVSLGIDGGVQRFGEYTMDGVGNSTTNTPDLEADKHIPDPYRNFNLGLNFKWEADIWGKLTDKKRASVARWMKSVEAMRLSRSLLISEVATQYFELIGLDRQREILLKAIDKAHKAYNLTSELMKEGEISSLSVDQFRSHRLKLEEMLIANEQHIEDKEYAMAALLGCLPFDVKRASFEVASKYTFPTQTGVPSQLLLFRPDVKAAEFELLASKSDVSAARKAFYPSLIIGGSGGYNAFDMNKWFTAPASMVYNLGAGITAPIFMQHSIRSMWSQAKSEQRIALLNYHETALNAYREVLELMTATSRMNIRIALKEEESRVHNRSIINANEMFNIGFASYLEVLSADEKYLSCELERINLNIESCKMHIMLYRALGGGADIQSIEQDKAIK